jgi:hypothetical protein
VALRRIFLGAAAVLLGSCGGGQSINPVQPSSPKVLTLSISRGSLVLNQKVPTSVALTDFQFQLLVNGQVANTLPGNTPSTTVSIPLSTTQTAYKMNLVGPAGFILSQPCEGTTTTGTIVCSGQIVDTRPICDDTVINYIYKATDRLTVVTKCTAVIVNLAEVSDSDEDDSDREGHGVPDARFSAMLTSGNAAMNGWLVLEAICLCDNVKNPEALDACGQFKKNYPKTGPAKNIVFPQLGGRAVVVGISVKDARHANWAEIHGISYLFAIPTDSGLADFATPSTPEHWP